MGGAGVLRTLVPPGATPPPGPKVAKLPLLKNCKVRYRWYRNNTDGTGTIYAGQAAACAWE
jgi:hypothetical protein